MALSKIEDAHFVLSQQQLFAQLGVLEELPVRIAYSVKSNYEVATALLSSSCDFHLHTKGDFEQVKDGTRVWFLLQGTLVQDITFLLQHNVTRFIVDNTQDLHRLLECIEQYKINVTILLRVRMQERALGSGRFYTFGMPVQTVKEHLRTLSHHIFVEHVGIHFHKKTQNTAEWQLQHDLSSKFSEEDLQLCSYVNLGGGLPVAYKNSSDAMLTHIFKQITTCAQWLEQFEVQTIIEPGRFLSGPSVQLHTYIQAIHDETIIVNASVYNCAMDSILVNPTRLLVQGEGEGESYTIKGCTPDSLDIFRYDVRLKDPKVGDCIVFMHAGAYNYSSNYYKLPQLRTDVK